MSYVGRDFTIFDPTETRTLAFDFVRDFRPGETIVSSVWTITLRDGTDPDPAAHLIGISTNLGTVSSHVVSGLVPNTIYILKADAVTSLGNTISLYAHARCQYPR